ncbi:MAG: peptide chain release factor N(5)-glutamine methyltransferase [Candidatus Doudnabacteria bacterium]|nr:peptide chain release factor N(5)-glutamine methyltransferase [Candidatus Doudnabacteria bacterium]
MTVKEALRLHDDAAILLGFVLKKDPAYRQTGKVFLFSHPEKQLTRKQTKKFDRLIKSRQEGVPLAYLTGEKEFFGLKFFVNKKVLIPRPETETLVEIILNKIRGRPYKKRSPIIEPLKILDLGTGSGNIIVSIARNVMTKPAYRTDRQSHLRDRHALRARDRFLFFASDISKRALAVAKKNARRHQVSAKGGKITFKQGSLLEPWKNQGFDIIVANLPYGWKEWKNNTSAETVGLKFEPQNALFTKKNGLAIYEKFFEQIAKYYNPPQSPLILRGDETASTPPLKIRGGRGELLPKLIALEFDPRQLQQIKKLAEKFLPAYEIQISKDLSGRPRFLSIFSIS